MKLKLISLMTMAAFSAAAMAQVNPAHDEFYWISQINKASIVINSDEGLLDKKDEYFLEEICQKRNFAKCSGDKTMGLI